ncbi:DUF4374 domain-containing protein [Sphingobacterium deserti]|uniref:DUF4374 domain-containing protein n=1 Tax=Sphingobacterium deserti TaxID=1229276 RepID=A0A0B8T2T3_9SPHI|nr:DUF4374 domain-containing protein [Sphingobacterium deserti]KGE15316.1 hypothetical protein DI53_0997 [Sphingobacterium deserti]
MRTINTLSLFAGLGLALSSCSKSDGPTQVETPGSYVIAAATLSSTNSTDYLLTAPSLQEGSITTTGTGVEQLGYRTYVQAADRIFSFRYGQGNPGSITSYTLAEGNLSAGQSLQGESTDVNALVGDDVLMIRNNPRFNIPNIIFTLIDGKNVAVKGTASISNKDLAGNGEVASLSTTPILLANNKVLAPFYTVVDGTGRSEFLTNYLDESRFAVFSYPSMTLEKTFLDKRTGILTSGVHQTRNGDVYAFAGAGHPNYWSTTTTYPLSKNPSGILKINANTLETDATYFFDLTAASGGHRVRASKYIADNLFFLAMYGDANAARGAKTRYAIVDVASKQFKWVTGLPSTINESGFPVYVENGTVSVGVNGESENIVYQVNAQTAVATKGLKVDGLIKSIMKL